MHSVGAMARGDFPARRGWSTLYEPGGRAAPRWRGHYRAFSRAPSPPPSPSCARSARSTERLARRPAARVLHGGEPPATVEIREEPRRALSPSTWVHGQKTGFFLDQREKSPPPPRPSAPGCRGWPTCSPTPAGFSVYAALAGATRVSTVDSAAPRPWRRARRPTSVSTGSTPARHEFACEDAFAWLGPPENTKFGLVITDPAPASPRRKKSVGKALSAYRDLNALALAAVAPGGLLAAPRSCSSHVSLEDFLGAPGATRARRSSAARLRHPRGARPARRSPVAARLPRRPLSQVRPCCEVSDRDRTCAPPATVVDPQFLVGVGRRKWPAGRCRPAHTRR